MRGCLPSASCLREALRLIGDDRRLCESLLELSPCVLVMRENKCIAGPAHGRSCSCCFLRLYRVGSCEVFKHVKLSSLASCSHSRPWVSRPKAFHQVFSSKKRKASLGNRLRSCWLGAFVYACFVLLLPFPSLCFAETS